MNKRLNKRGDVPVVILVLGVIAICGLTIFSFITFKQLDDESSLEKGLYLFEQVYVDLEKFEFYKNVGNNDIKAADKIKDLRIEGNNLIIEKEDEGIGIRYEKIISVENKNVYK